MHGTQRLWAGVAVLAVLAFALDTSVAGAAKFGNSANTKIRKGTGYQNRLPSDGVAFDSPAACHSYAVHGGVLRLKVTPGSGGTPLFQQACNALAGTFSTEVVDGINWLCTWGSLTENGGSITEFQWNVNETKPGDPYCPCSLAAGTMWAGTAPGNVGFGLVRCDTGMPG